MMEKRHFETEADNYLHFRPTYPPELAAILARLAPDQSLAVDAGCGTGQFSTLLAPEFRKVVALDISPAQIKAATPVSNVTYICSAAHKTGLENREVDLLVTAQAAHWFNLSGFYAEAKRILKPEGVIALVTYGTFHLEGEINERVQSFYQDEIGPYWPAERAHVENGYRDFDFPFRELTLKAPAIRCNWTLKAFTGYIATWSACKLARKAGRADLIDRFVADLTPLWGAPDAKRRITWPVNVRIGKI